MSDEVRKGEPWGRPVSGPPDATVAGGDADLAQAAARLPGRRIAFIASASSDLARALGMSGADRELPVDGLQWDGAFALNAVVLGTAPDRMRSWSRGRQLVVRVDGRERFAGRATAVVVANGQYLRGNDLVPRGHPGDGRVEVQVYALRPGERGEMRRRLRRGDHLPHPRIHAAAGARVDVTVEGRPLPVEADGLARGRAGRLTVEVVPAAVWLRL